MTAAQRVMGSVDWLRPLLALVMPPLAWFAYEVGLAAALRVSCIEVGAGLGVAWGGVSLVACGLAAWLAWPTARPAGASSSSSLTWLSHVALLGTGVCALAIAFQTIATLIVPPCAR